MPPMLLHSRHTVPLLRDFTKLKRKLQGHRFRTAGDIGEGSRTNWNLINNLVIGKSDGPGMSLQKDGIP